jgi:tetratricopeptide (TPR) repeat protein
VIIALLALAVQAAAPNSARSDEALYRSCTQAVKRDANKAVEQANTWYVQGGGLFAKVCLGMAYTALQRWEPAAIAFEQGAREAESAKDPRGADLWTQSGNAWLAADSPLKARAAFDSALIIGKISPALRGEIQFDRARANVALGDLPAARIDLDKGLELVPKDGFGWYLSAALALRQEAVTRAQQDIAKAVQIAPDDADVLLLAGNIAGMSGETDAARSFYERTIKSAPNGDAAKQAQKQLEANSTDTPNGLGVAEAEEEAAAPAQPPKTETVKPKAPAPKPQDHQR